MEETRSNENAASRRSLGAILITDAAGFSALASRDEARALDQLTNDMEVMRSCCERFGGRIIKSTGDGYLMFFDSAVNAVNCAMDIRSAMAVRTGEGQFLYRIGVHLGDVVLTADDAYGDGVNVAARLQAGASPGAVWISQTVFDVIRGKLPCRCVFEGDKSFKGLAARVPVWSVAPGEGIVGGPKRHAPLWALVAAPVLLIAAIGLAVVSAQMQGKAAEDVQLARKERDQLLQILARADGGTPMRQFQFDKMKAVVEQSSKPDDPEARALVKKLEGLNTWKGWMSKRLETSTPQKPVQVALNTPAGPKSAVLYHVEGKGVQLKDATAVRDFKFEELDPETLTAISDSLSGLEPREQREKIKTWMQDFKTIYARRAMQRLPKPGDTPKIRIERQTGATERQVSDSMKEVEKAVNDAGVEFKFIETPDVPTVEPPEAKTPATTKAKDSKAGG